MEAAAEGREADAGDDVVANICTERDSEHVGLLLRGALHVADQRYETISARQRSGEGGESPIQLALVPLVAPCPSQR